MAELEHVRGWIDWNLRNYQQHGFGLWSLERKSSGALIGDCGLTYQDVEGRQELEIGYHVHHAMRRNGYATEAASACLDYAFENVECEQVCSIVHPGNAASRAVAGRVHADCREFQKEYGARLVFLPRARLGSKRAERSRTCHQPDGVAHRSSWSLGS